MSQEKVMKYKEEKVNRKANVKKAKRMKKMRNVIACLICLVAVVWVGYSGVTYYMENQPRQEVEVDYTDLDNYMNELQ